MTVAPSPYDILRAIQDQQRATDRLVQMLLGMLDKSAPDPFLSADVASIEGAVRAIPMPKGSRRVTEESARPPVLMTIEGVEVKTTKRRAKLLTSVMESPLTLTDMMRRAIAPTVAGVKAQIIDTNRDLERAGLALRVRMQALPAQRRGARGGRLPALYALLGPKDTEIAVPASTTEPVMGIPIADAIPEIAGVPTAENPGQNDRLPEQGPVGREGCETARLGPSTCETPSGADTGSDVEVVAARPPEAKDSPPAAPPAAVSPPAPKPAFLKPTPVRSLKMRIEPGDLIAVDVKAREIVTLKSVYQVAGANLARALEKMKGGDLFGIDVVAKVAGWPTAEVARTALGFERKRLAEHGIDLWMDKFNVRLRRAS